MRESKRQFGRGRARGKYNGRYTRDNTMDIYVSSGETIHVQEITQSSHDPRTVDTIGAEDGDSRQDDDESHGDSSQRHTSTATYVGNNDTTQENKSSPPLDPTTLPQRNAAAFKVKTYNTAEQIKIKIVI